METLEDQFRSLSIGNSTGVMLDLEQLKHKSLKQHVECPARLSSIFQHLSAQNLLNSPQVELIHKLPRADRAIIEYVHDSSYVDFIEGMWPAETKKKEFYLLDTYYNEHSSHAAYIGAGGVIQSVDRIMKTKDWHNAFCVIRPPGHHSGHSKVCTGFCFFNNVAVGTRYVQRNYGVKRVLIFDWDIHHGDGTQNIFKDDPSVLFVSLHRHDDGSFYPQSGSVSNQGEGAGKGFSVNIPWDIGYSEEALKAGTDEYIYAFERIVRPIVEEFDPEFVFISAGFDSAEGDPLGQCKLTYEGYAYMTQRLMDMMKGRNIIACLEGGYNLESISWAAESVLRVLIGESFPLPKNKRQMSLDELKASIIPNSVGFSAVMQCVNAYKDQWKCLGEFGNEYDKQILMNVQKNSLISAGHEKNFIIRGDVLLKKCKKPEMDFYKDLIDPESKFAKENELLRRFIPGVRGFETIDGADYVALENLTYTRENASIIDFKLGKSTIHASCSQEKQKTQKKKDTKSTTNSQGYRISGAIIKDNLGIPCETLSRGMSLQNLKQKDVVEFTKKIFMSNNAKQLNVVALKDFVTFLENLLEFFVHTNTRSFISSSIVALVDNLTHQHMFKLVDFNYVDEILSETVTTSSSSSEHTFRDKNVIFGLENLLSFTSTILTVNSMTNKIKNPNQ